LQANGINDIIINVHHFAGQVVGFLKEKEYFGANIAISFEDEMLLDTGGGLKKAAWFFDDGQPFLVQNVDVISDLNYSDILEVHHQTQSMATLAVCKRDTSRYFLFDTAMQLCGWENIRNSEVRMARKVGSATDRFAFSGIHIVDPKIFNFMLAEQKFSIVDTYLKLAATQRITGFVHSAENWIDMGKPEALIQAELLVKKMRLK